MFQFLKTWEEYTPPDNPEPGYRYFRKKISNPEHKKTKYLGTKRDGSGKMVENWKPGLVGDGWYYQRIKDETQS